MFLSQSGHSRGFGLKSRSGVDEIRAEQTHIRHQPPHNCTHTQTHPHKVSRARWGRKKKNVQKTKREGKERKTEVEGKSQKRERRRNLGV